MMKQKQHLSTCVLGLCTALLLSACNPQSNSNTAADSNANATASNPATHADAATASAKAEPIKSFAATADDMQDIARIDEFHEKFNAMSLEYAADLKHLRESNNLTAEMQQNRQREHAQSALKMLNALELKTEQGRYIQGLLYQYWENQQQAVQHVEATASPHGQTDTTQAQSDLLTAQAQFKHWKLQL